MVKRQVAKIVPFLFAFFAFVSLSHINVAHAQKLSDLSDEDRNSVGEALQSAQQSFKIKDYGNAIASLERAYGLFPEPNILYRIGIAYEKLTEFKVANLYFRRYLALRPDAKDAAGVRAHIKSNDIEVARIENVEVLRYEINIVTNPPGAEIVLDGIPKGKSPLKIEALTGRHLIEVTKKDFLQSSVFINISNKDERLNIRLEPFEEPYSAPIWPWVAIGVGAGTMAVSLIAFDVSNTAQVKVDKIDLNKAELRPVERKDLVRDAEIYERIGYGTLIGGGILFGLGAYSLLLSSSKPKSAFRLTGDGFAVKF